MTDLSDYASLSEKVAALGADDELILTPAEFPETPADHRVFFCFVPNNVAAAKIQPHR